MVHSASIALPTPAAARTWTAPGDAPTVQTEVDSAGDGDTVLVAPGTYTESVYDTIPGSLWILADGPPHSVMLEPPPLTPGIQVVGRGPQRPHRAPSSSRRLRTLVTQNVPRQGTIANHKAFSRLTSESLRCIMCTVGAHSAEQECTSQDPRPASRQAGDGAP